MADNSTGSGNEPLLVRIQQLEQERDELRKDIEQLCMQQAGPGYLVVATKMHFQRTAALEQEIENLKKKLASCTRDNVNLQEELSEAYRIKSQLADLHNAEVTKNLEAEKQLKFFQGCVAAAFAERDHSIMEAEKAKEKEEIMHQKLSDVQKRMEELYSDCLEKEKLIDKLQADLVKQEEDNEAFKKVIDMFYEIRQQSFEGCDNRSWDQKSTCLLSDPPETWSYNDLSTSNYISALEEELQSVRNSVDDLQNKLRVGLEIENHLKKKVRELEKKKLASDKMMRSSLAGLRHHHSIHRLQIMNVLEDEKSYIKSVVSMMNNKIRQVTETGEMNVELPFSTMGLHKNGSSDQNLNIDAGLDLISYTGLKQVDQAAMGDATEAFAQALQEKVSALLLLSQQEERHLLDRNVNAALQKKIEELQRNLLQVTNEKVKALMELAKLREDYQLLQEKTGPGMKGKDFAAREENRLVMQEQDGKLRNLLKKTYLNRWIGSTMEFARKVGEVQVNYEGNVSSRKSNNSIEFARMKIENATLKESLESVDHLTSSIHRLRVSLSQAKESAAGGTVVGVSEALEEIISEALLVKTALSSCLPVSWSAGEDTEPSLSATVEYASADSSSEKVDSVSAAGFEMVELLILAAQTVKEYMNRRMAS